MNYLVAVSGGVDSVVLLDMLTKQKKHQLVVVHFDHGIRDDSAADARFVEGLAKKYQLPFVSRREELGPRASEAAARKQRYAFLRLEAKRRNGVIVTAHHGDDIVETIAINIQRGTGWRGVAVLDSADVLRPLLAMTKQDIYAYALENRLEWVEDSTNRDTTYLRNRLRKRLAILDETDRHKLAVLRGRQVELRQAIRKEVGELVKTSTTYKRYFFISIDSAVAIEVLRQIIEQVSGKLPTHPQVSRALLAIKTAQNNTIYEMGSGVRLRFSQREFTILPPQKVIS